MPFCEFEDTSMDGIHQSTEEMDSCEDSFTYGIDRLPDEVLIEIIAYLPLRDRKNARLVSKQWSNLNNDRQISRNEKFLCHGVYGLHSVLETLEDSKKKVLNIQFIHFDFSTNTDQLSKFWENNGRKIESLIFLHCKLSEKTMQDIILHCEKIKYFAIKNPLAKFPPCEKDEKLMSGPALEELVNIRRGNLHSFNLEAYEKSWISNNFLRVMFDIYPNIDDFSFICPDLIDEEDYITTNMTYEDLLRSDEKLTFANILKKLVESRKVMRSINLDAAQIDLHADLMLYNFPELSSVGNVCLEADPEHPIFEFLSRHNLRFIEFNLQIDGEDCLFVENLMHCLLDSCTQLETLKIDITEEIFSTDDRIFTKITTSKLKSLHLNFLLEATRSNPIVNKTLKYLHLSRPNEVFSNDCELVSAFIKTFRGLKELMIDRLGINDQVLQDIFQYQRQLKSLKLRSLGLVHQDGFLLTDYGFTGIDSNGQRTGYSMKDLKQLQCLEISRWDDGETKIFFEELKFPNLSYLFLNVYVPQELLENGKFEAIFSGLPNLETVVFKGDRYDRFSSWLKICKQLKKLRFLFLETYFPLCHELTFTEPALYEYLLEDCSTLQVVQSKIEFLSAEDSVYLYYLDTRTKRVKIVTRPEEQLLSPVMIYPYWERII